MPLVAETEPLLFEFWIIDPLRKTPTNPPTSSAPPDVETEPLEFEFLIEP